MKKLISLVFITLVAALALSLLSCGNNAGNGSADPTPPQEDEHTHAFDKMRVDDSYLKSVADCSKPAAYFYSCACGEAGTKAFLNGSALGHIFDEKNIDVKYLKSAASCQHPAVYYYSCKCGAVGENSFEYGDIAAHEYGKFIDAKYCKTEATCMAVGVYYYSCACGATNGELFHGTALGDHVYDQQVVKDKYLCSPANGNTAALYYYSCKCGDAGTDVFKYASTTPTGWTAISKTVYGIVQGGCIRFEAKDSSMVKLNFDFAQSFTAVSTNGTWYKISMGGSDYGYVRCSHVTDNKGTVTFTDASSKYTDAVVLDGKSGVYLQTDMIGSSSVFVTYEASHDGYISVLAINQTGDWVKVRFNGYDSNGAYHEAKTVFYCQTKDLFLRPW